MKNLLIASAALIALAAPAIAMISVANVDTLDDMPDHLKIRTSPAQDDLINVWVTIIEPKPEGVNVWASLSTRVGGKLVSRANLAFHPQKEGFSVSFQMPKESFEESTVMISLRGAGHLEDIGYELRLALFAP